MYIPEAIKKLAQSHGCNAVELVKQTKEESIYAVDCINADGTSLPVGFPHYIIDRGGSLSFVCDADFHITGAL